MVLAIGKLLLPLKLTVSPVVRSRAANPYSPGFSTAIAARRCSSSCSFDDVSAHAGCARQTASQASNPMNRIGTLRLKPFGAPAVAGAGDLLRSEEHTSELQSLMRISYAVF